MLNVKRGRATRPMFDEPIVRNNWFVWRLIRGNARTHPENVVSAADGASQYVNACKHHGFDVRHGYHGYHGFPQFRCDCPCHW